MMKKIILIAIIVIACGAIIMDILNPLRSSNEEIRENMLALTPIDTSMADVEKTIKEHSWELVWINDEFGYGMGKDGYPSGYYDDFYDEIGKKSICIYMGDYGILFIRYKTVIVYYGFDEESKLVDISVHKETDSM
ncbi:hypothetical protein NIA71_11480 [Ihubacter massiliensis]|uniref:Uncharacterized protein n=1 Tax=Hominibacterium faecale TaxID=2839743 RepID=A0A9J6QRB5_9FIRM|nr:MULTISPECIES: hypothetical protein [Eubacteriales Family XIII. Incertae Sedis]MCO7122563.1 hypothetical protein [Ihubacter massiliensis]MCU7376839.1 hypothetical protein [Hominibacterium faecale]MCU7379388.1 hypothetical protein [Hominibacterium faecale]